MALLLEMYHKAHPDENPAHTDPDAVSAWAIREGVYDHKPVSPGRALRRLITQHLRSEYSVDPQGRDVREHHVVVTEIERPDGSVVQKSDYYRLRQAPLQHMQLSLQLRKRSSQAIVVQVETDRRSYNDNNVFGAQLPPMDYDFNKDIEELDQPTTYPDAPPDGEGNDAN
jgi:hypothetical protein